MREVNVRVSYGKINLSAAHYSLATLRVQAPFQRESAANTGRVDVKATQFADATLHPQVGGGFTTKTVAHDEGTIIMIQASRTRSRVRVADGCIFIRLRAGAPKLMVRSILPTSGESILGDRHIAFVGSGDVLTLEELKAIGIEVPRSWASGYMQQDEIDELFLMEELNRGSESRPTFVRIATSKGVEVRAIQPEPVRRMRLRR